MYEHDFLGPTLFHLLVCSTDLDTGMSATLFIFCLKRMVGAGGKKSHTVVQQRLRGKKKSRSMVYGAAAVEAASALHPPALF